MALQALLDTNIGIYIARNRPPAVAERFAPATPGSLGISLITWDELCFGTDKSNDPIRANERRCSVDKAIKPLNFASSMASDSLIDASSASVYDREMRFCDM